METFHRAYIRAGYSEWLASRGTIQALPRARLSLPGMVIHCLVYWSIVAVSDEFTGSLCPEQCTGVIQGEEYGIYCSGKPTSCE